MPRGMSGCSECSNAFAGSDRDVWIGAVCICGKQSIPVLGSAIAKALCSLKSGFV